MQVFIFLGAPGAGKGTAAAKIAETTNARHISTGAMLRDAVKQGTPSGLSAKSYMDKGELVPDQVLIEMIGELFASSDKNATLILDGFPRTVPQAEALEKLASKYGVEIVKAINIEVPDDIVLKRLGGRRVCPACGAGFHTETLPPKTENICDTCATELVIRDDDKPATIRNRLHVYTQKTAPLIGWYESAAKLSTADGSGTADTVAENIKKVMSKG